MNLVENAGGDQKGEGIVVGRHLGSICGPTATGDACLGGNLET